MRPIANRPQVANLPHKKSSQAAKILFCSSTGQHSRNQDAGKRTRRIENPPQAASLPYRAGGKRTRRIENPPQAASLAASLPYRKSLRRLIPVQDYTATVQWGAPTALMIPNVQRASPLRVVIVMPLRDDWVSAAELIRQLDRTISQFPCTLTILLVDDGSVQRCNAADFQSRYEVVRSIRVLRLRRNLGHQRAIAIGLVYVDQSVSCDAVLIMDADGEDTPDGALKLISALSGAESRKAIFASRSRRTESAVFRIFYRLYKLVHRVLTGVGVRVGNFSIIPAESLGTLVIMSELWNHYAAAVFRSGLPLTMIPIPRGHRIAGKSRMNFVALATHGMSAISVFGDVVGVRLLLACIAGSVAAALGIVVVVCIRLFTEEAIPGWATYAAGTLAIILIQLLTIAISFTFIMLSNRINLGFIPLRDYALFIADARDIYSDGRD